MLPTVYLSALQAPSRSSIVVIRSARPDADAIAAVREEVARLDPTVPVSRARSMQEVVAASPGMPARRVMTATFMAFAVLALVLGAIGLFGVAAHDVASRRTELALRIALGADPMRILGATLARGAVLVASGLAVGGVLSIWAARALGSAGFAADRLDALSIAVPDRHALDSWDGRHPSRRSTRGKDRPSRRSSQRLGELTPWQVES